MRYVIPADAPATARPPTEGFIIQDINSGIATNTAEIQTYFGSGSLSNSNQQKGFKLISGAVWSSSEATISTELPHKLNIEMRLKLKISRVPIIQLVLLNLVSIGHIVLYLFLVLSHLLLDFQQTQEPLAVMSTQEQTPYLTSSVENTLTLIMFIAYRKHNHRFLDSRMVSII